MKLKLSFRVVRKMATLFDDVAPPGTFNLRMGAPGKDLLNKSALILKEAANNRLAQSNACDLMTYGPIFGDDMYKTQLQSFLTSQYSHEVDKNDIVQTCGATHGLHILSTVLFSDQSLVFAESTSYFLALGMFRNAFKRNIVPVDIDSNGIDPDALEDSLKTHLSSKKDWKPTPSRPYWALLYLIPQYHNPTGVCLTPDRSRKIVELARRYDLLAVCDDVYNLLYFPHQYSNGDTPPQRLFAFDKKTDADYKGNVVSNGSFSKIFGPGIRCGWLEAPGPVRESLNYSLLMQSGGATNHAMCGILSDVIQTGKLTQMVHDARLIFQERCKAVTDVFHRRLPFIEFSEPKGGYFIWLKLPDCINSEEFIERLIKEKKVTVFTGHKFSVDTNDKKFNQYIRISFAYYGVEELTTAANLIADLIIEQSPSLFI